MRITRKIAREIVEDFNDFEWDVNNDNYKSHKFFKKEEKGDCTYLYTKSTASEKVVFCMIIDISKDASELISASYDIQVDGETFDAGELEFYDEYGEWPDGGRC